MTGDKDNLRIEQQLHWESTLIRKQNAFGESPSKAARRAARLFQSKDAVHVLELGGGQGRDTIFLAEQGFQVTVLEFTQSGIDQIRYKANERGLSTRIHPVLHDVRDPLPFNQDLFHACFSHMLLCMAFTENELFYIMNEIRRVTVAGGIYSFTVRTDTDPQFRLGKHHGENLYEHNGFVVHFFTQELIGRLAAHDEILDQVSFEEGTTPKKLIQVTGRVNESP